MDFDVLVIGGGIQGVGVLHDLASRRITTHLLEERQLSIGTSSRSTKLLHGGLRYLERLGQWSLVREALNERSLLLRLLGDAVKPVPFVLPAYRSGRPPWMIRMGLGLYDLLAGDSGLPHARTISLQELRARAPYVRKERLEADLAAAFMFYDGQMLDDVIVRLAARASTLLGGSYEENSRVDHVERLESGFKVTGSHLGPTGRVRFEHRAKMVVMAAGAWNNWNLVKWGIAPQVPCILNAGSHLVLSQAAVTADPKNCAATLIQNSDGRVLFFIPWFGRWLFGTTESAVVGDPRNLKPSTEDVEYLFQALDDNFDLNTPRKNVDEIFCGVRTMPLRQTADKIKITPQLQEDPFQSPLYLQSTKDNLTRLSRESVVNEPVPGLLVVYGGKYTTYRGLSEQIGRQIKDRLGKGTCSNTRTADAWFLNEIREQNPEIFISSKELRSA
jgi:glycerol-3-phosphate dehydrogenase